MKNSLLKTSVIILIACIVAFSAELPSSVFSATTPYKANGRLSVSNGRVVNSKGKAFVIKGVSTHGLAWYPEYVNLKGFKTLRDKYGVNTIRLAMYTSEYNGYCTGGKKKELEKLIDNGVKYAHKLGMYVIIDWHILSDGNPKSHQKQAKAFFKKMAKKYSKYGNVMYEICNEPNGSGGTWKNIKSYSYSVIKTIRSVDKKAIIIVGTPTWSQDIENAVDKPIKGYKNIAYSFHFYAGTHKKAMRDRLESALKKKVPVIVTEFGISPASGNGTVNTSQGTKWINLLNKYKTGRVCWNLSNKNETSAIIKSKCKKKSGWTSSDLTKTGKFMLKAYTGKLTVKKDPASKDDTSSQTSPSDDKPSDNTTSEPITSVTAENCSMNVVAENSWQSGNDYCTQYKITVKNDGETTLQKWSAELTFDGAFTISGSWSGNFEKEGSVIKVTPLSWNEKLEKGESAELGLIITYNKTEQTFTRCSVF